MKQRLHWSQAAQDPRQSMHVCDEQEEETSAWKLGQKFASKRRLYWLSNDAAGNGKKKETGEHVGEGECYQDAGDDSTNTLQEELLHL